MHGAVVAAVLLALLSVAHAGNWKGTFETAEGTAKVRMTGLLVGDGSRVDGHWHCRGAACPVRRAKIRFKCLLSTVGPPTGTTGVLFTGRRNKPRRLWRFVNDTSCTVLFPNIQATLSLDDTTLGVLTLLKRGSPSGAFLEPVDQP
jgi:hypothetical protein